MPRQESSPRTRKKTAAARRRARGVDAILTLARWFAARKRVLPWRSQPTAYRVWISEIMLQQTQVVTVLPYFERFMKRFPTVKQLAEAPEAEVLEAWAGLGYYSRARNLHRGAKLVVAKGFPKTRDGWLEVPGVGPYTAGAIASIALGQVEPILDGNVERVLSRVLGFSRASMDGSQFRTRLWRWSSLLVRRADRASVEPSQFNQALMELGALVCKFRNPECGECPVRLACTAARLGRVDDFPGKKPAKKWLRVEEVRHAWIARELGAGGRSDLFVLVRRQKSGEWRAGLFDLPAEAPPVGAAARVGEVETRHVVTRHRIERRTEIWNLRRRLAAPEGMEWVPLDFGPAAASSALAKTLQAVRGLVGSAPGGE